MMLREKFPEIISLPNIRRLDLPRKTIVVATLIFIVVAGVYRLLAGLFR
jgi:hypothetical protein